MTDITPTLDLDTFWDWISTHPNCILRAGSRDAVIYDDEDYHWHFAREAAGALLVQVIRGKRLLGELFIPREQIVYVQGVLGDQEGEFVFELVGGDESDAAAVFFFVLTHGYELEEESAPGRVH